jgi:hypothetical protein
MAQVCDVGDVWRILMRKPRGEKIIRHRWNGNIKKKKDLNRIGCEGVEWTELAHNRVKAR